MGIPESQLETWSHQGAITTAKATADSIKNALGSYTGWPDGTRFEVYLQGSYKNDTNIRGDSDVDVVAQLNSCFYSNLSEDEKKLLGLVPASHSLSDFRQHAINALRKYYGQSGITEGNNSIKKAASAGRLSADVVICSEYRRYKTLNIDDYAKGIFFRTRTENRQVINYPKIHYENGVTKHKDTGGWYKPIVRLFKNCRGSIPGDPMPSYFLECMIYNVPGSEFGGTYADTFYNIVNWLRTAELNDLNCQNNQIRLLGNTPEQCDIDKAKVFIGDLILLWNN